MSKKTIWDLLKAKGFSDVAAAAIIGNMEAESNCIPYRIQGDFSAGYQKSKDYTANVDHGVISKDDFIYHGPGGGGYGLMQWTYFSRKAGLYDLTVPKSISIGDEAQQVNWLVEELNQGEFQSVMGTLVLSNSIRECSDSLIKKYLRPADQSEAACVQRAKLGQDFYNEFAIGQAEDPDGQPGMIQVSEEEYNMLKRAELVVMYMKDILQMLEEFNYE